MAAKPITEKEKDAVRIWHEIHDEICVAHIAKTLTNNLDNLNCSNYVCPIVCPTNPREKTDKHLINMEKQVMPDRETFKNSLKDAGVFAAAEVETDRESEEENHRSNIENIETFYSKTIETPKTRIATYNCLTSNTTRGRSSNDNASLHASFLCEFHDMDVICSRLDKIHIRGDLDYDNYKDPFYFNQHEKRTYVMRCLRVIDTIELGSFVKNNSDAKLLLVTVKDSVISIGHFLHKIKEINGVLNTSRPEWSDSLKKQISDGLVAAKSLIGLMKTYAVEQKYKLKSRDAFDYSFKTRIRHNRSLIELNNDGTAKCDEYYQLKVYNNSVYATLDLPRKGFVHKCEISKNIRKQSLSSTEENIIVDLMRKGVTDKRIMKQIRDTKHYLGSESKCQDDYVKADILTPSDLYNIRKKYKLLPYFHVKDEEDVKLRVHRHILQASRGENPHFYRVFKPYDVECTDHRCRGVQDLNIPKDIFILIMMVSYHSLLKLCLL